ncbi:uncharacterized protein [Branchiostoma lanceolatum]|uniref:uncharacterized protein n=1 Tax=Branchiostoma lanceolatum TaxID=7740 RepID=UPI003451A30C
MVLVGSVVLPHGTMIFDGDPKSSNEGCRQRHAALDEGMKTSCSSLYTACSSAGEEVSRMTPDLVILHTPHGISLSRSVGVYVNPVAKGTAEWNDYWDDIKLELPMDKELANKFLTHLGDCGIDAQGICCFTNYDAPLRWGEVVPLWFIQKNLRNPVKYLIISQSLLRGEEALKQRLSVGRALSAFIDSLSDTRVVMAISGDLAHTHPHSCDNPLYQPNPRWNMPEDPEAAGMFGRCAEGWAKSAPTDLLTSAALEVKVSGEMWDPVVAEQWLKRANELHPKALSCGIGGFWVLHAMLYSQIERGVSFSHKFLAREAPTYYGMMVTLFLKKQ